MHGHPGHCTAWASTSRGFPPCDPSLLASGKHVTNGCHFPNHLERWSCSMHCTTPPHQQALLELAESSLEKPPSPRMVRVVAALQLPCNNICSVTATSLQLTLHGQLNCTAHRAQTHAHDSPCCAYRSVLYGVRHLRPAALSRTQRKKCQYPDQPICAAHTHRPPSTHCMSQ